MLGSTDEQKSRQLPTLMARRKLVAVDDRYFVRLCVLSVVHNAIDTGAFALVARLELGAN
jgi:hypothetical protein